MPRGTYKTGAKRDRRKIGLGAPPDPAINVISTFPAVNNAATGSIAIGISGWYQGTNTQADQNGLIYTGLASTTRLVDSAGSVWAPTGIAASGGGMWEYTFDQAVATGGAVFTLGAQDPAVRGPLGEWSGACAIQLTVV